MFSSERAGEELIVLKHGADHLAKARGTELLHRHATHANLPDAPAGSRPIMILRSVVLPQPDGPTIATAFSGVDIETRIVEHVGLAVCISEAHVAHLEGRARAVSRSSKSAALGVLSGGVNTMSASCSPCSCIIFSSTALVDEPADPLGELILVGDEREQHADGEVIVHHEQRRDPDDADALDTEQRACSARYADSTSACALRHSPVPRAD